MSNQDRARSWLNTALLFVCAAMLSHDAGVAVVCVIGSGAALLLAVILLRDRPQLDGKVGDDE